MNCLGMDRSFISERPFTPWPWFTTKSVISHELVADCTIFGAIARAERA